MDVHCSFCCSFSSDCHEISFGKWLYLFRLYGFSIKVQGSGFKLSSYRRYLLWRFPKETNLLKAGRLGESKTLAQKLCDFRSLTSHSLLISIKKEPEGSFYFRFLHTCHAERTKQSVTMPAVTSVMASSWLRVRQRANAVRIARKRSLLIFFIGDSEDSNCVL